MEDIKIHAFTDEASEDIDSQVKALKRNALMGIELRGTELGNVADLSFVAACYISKKLRDSGASVWALGSPIGKISITDSFAPHLEKLRNLLELCKVFGTKYVRIFSFYIPAGHDPSEYRGEVMDRLVKMAEMARPYGVTLCHENEKGIYGDNAERCLDIYKTIPDIKGIFDPANFVQCGVDTLKSWEALGGYIKYMHIKDATSDGKVVPAGCGDANLEYIVSEFIKNGGRDFTIEPHLTVFKGLENLERKGDTKSQASEKYAYKNSDEAFDAACDAFKKLVKSLQEATV